MIYELEQSYSLFLTIDCPFPEARAVLQGNNPGWVFADDPGAPKTALVWAQGIQGFYLVGDPGSTRFLESLDETIDHVIVPRLFALGVAWFEVSGGENWNAVIESAFKHRNLESSQQWVFRLKPVKHVVAVQPEIIGDGKLLRIDRRLLDDFPQRAQGHLLSKIKLFWGSESAFLQAGLGYVLVYRGEIVSLCFSGFVAGDIHAIDIETLASHRKKGFAEAVGRAYIEECINKSLQPHWDCMASNIASVRLAGRLGLTRHHNYTLYSFPL